MKIRPLDCGRTDVTKLTVFFAILQTRLKMIPSQEQHSIISNLDNTFNKLHKSSGWEKPMNSILLKKKFRNVEQI
jgi:hypothetical protein